MHQHDEAFTRSVHFTTPNRHLVRSSLYPVVAKVVTFYSRCRLQENFTEKDTIRIRADSMYSYYRHHFCCSVLLEPKNKAQFGKILKTAFPSVKKRRLGPTGRQVAYYVGIGRRNPNTSHSATVPVLWDCASPSSKPQSSAAHPHRTPPPALLPLMSKKQNSAIDNITRGKAIPIPAFSFFFSQLLRGNLPNPSI